MVFNAISRLARIKRLTNGSPYKKLGYDNDDGCFLMKDCRCYRWNVGGLSRRLKGN